MGPFFSKPIFSPKKIIFVNLKTLCTGNFKQKFRKIPRVNFSWNLQNFIIGPFWVLLAKYHPQSKIFSLKLQQSVFKLDDNLTLHAKNQIISKICPGEKIQTNEQKKRGYFKEPSHRVSENKITKIRFHLLRCIYVFLAY